MITDDAIIIRNDKTAWQIIDDKVIVVTPKTRKIHIFSGVGGRIWECLKGPKSLNQLLDIVCDEYDVDRQQAGNDIKDFIRESMGKEIMSLKSKEQRA